ncbi:MAG: DUF92 domain-containing protein [Anaerolineae bacterium]|nr:MAG: DUF92 domain-containing protein [Anaerolineae bacterium]
MADGVQLALGFGLAALVGVAAWRTGALAPSGALAAALVGGLLFGFGGAAGAVLLLAFFVSSSGLSRAFAARKADLAEKFEKGSRRDWAQVLANGGVAAFCAVLLPLFPDAAWPWLALAGALATANGDTWATELGTLSRRTPFLITTLEPVPRGTSGGVTQAGTLATLAGAALIGMLAANFLPQFAPARLILAVTFAGFGGAFVDSLLGATVQGIYRDADGRETEKRPAPDAVPLRGFAAFNNDVVNFLATAAGALIAVLLG